MVFGGMVWGVDSDALITVLLSLTTREFHSLKSLLTKLLGGEAAPVPSRSKPSQPKWPVRPVPRHPEPSEQPRPEPSEPSPEPELEAPVTPVSLRPEPFEPSQEAELEAPVAPVSLGPEPSQPSPEPELEAPVTPVSLGPEPSELSPEPELEAPVTPVSARPEPSSVSMIQQAQALEDRADYEGAWRLYYGALQATPEDVSLWYGLGVTLSHLNQPKETEEAFRYVVRHGRPDSEEVRLARRWLADASVLAEQAALTRAADARRDKASVKRSAARRAAEPSRAPVQPPRPLPSETRPVRQSEARVTAVPRRPEPSNVDLARQAEALAARGDYEGAWRLYYKAVQATPDDVSLWYALGVTASQLSQRKEPEQPLQYTARHDRLDPKEVRHTDRAIMSAGALAELAALTRAPDPVREGDKAAVKGNVARRASEPAREAVQPPRSKPSEPSMDRRAETRVTQRDYEAASGRSAPRYRIDGESMTREEREQALLSLIEEGYKMPPSRTELIARVMQMRHNGDKEKSKAPKKARRRTHF